MQLIRKTVVVLSLALSTMLFGACGGGGGDDPAPGNGGNNNPPATWGSTNWDNMNWQ